MKVINNGFIENNLLKHFDSIIMKKDFYVLLNVMQIRNVLDVNESIRISNIQDLLFFFLGKYSEPLKSLLDQLSEKLSNSSTKRPTSHEPIDVNNKRNAPMSK